MLKPVLTTADIAKVLRLSEKSVRDPRFRQRIGLHGIKIGRSLRFLEDDVKRLLKPKTPCPKTYRF